MFKRMAIATLAISALLVVGCSEDATNPIQPADTVPPLAPIMTGGWAQGDLVTINWQTNTEPDLAGYNVYIDGPNGPIRVTSKLVTQTYLVFAAPYNGGSINVYATAVDYSGNESSGSQQVAVDLRAVRNASRLPVEDINEAN